MGRSGSLRFDDNGVVAAASSYGQVVEALSAAVVAALTESAGPYALLIGAGFLIAVYGHAAKMPRVLAFGILFVLLSSLLAILVSFTLDGGGGPQVKP